MTEKKDERTLEQRLIAALWNMPNPPKNATAKVPTKNGGSYSYSYATLDCVLDVVKPALKAEGLALLQCWDEIPGETGCWMLMTGVTDGVQLQWLDRRPIGTSTDPQRQGAVETYLRRYAIVTAFGLAAVEDTDAQHTAEPARPATARDRLIDACRRYAAATGKDAGEVMREVSARDGFKADEEGFAAAAEHVESLLGR